MKAEGGNLPLSPCAFLYFLSLRINTDKLSTVHSIIEDLDTTGGAALR